MAANVIDGLSLSEARQIASDVFGESKDERVETIRNAVYKLQVAGSNVVESGVSHSRLEKGGIHSAPANFLTAVEEIVEGRWKAGAESGRYKKAQMLQWVRMAEEATGEKYLTAMTDEEVLAHHELSPRALTEAISRIVVADALGRRLDGSRMQAGLITDALAKSQHPERGMLAAVLRAFRELLRQVFHTARKLKKARREGKLGDDWETILDDLLGTAQTVHEREAEKEADAIANEALYAGGASYSEANPGPNGETFSLVKRDPMTPVSVVTVPGDVLQGTKIKELRASAFAWAESNGVYGEHENADTGWSVRVDQRTLEHAFQHMGAENIHAVTVIPELLRGAILTEKNADKKKSPQILEVSRLKAAFEFRGKLYSAKLTVKEHVDKGHHLYDLQSVEIKEEPDFSGLPERPEGLSPGKSDSQVTLGDIAPEVKASFSLRNFDSSSRLAPAAKTPQSEEGQAQEGLNGETFSLSKVERKFAKPFDVSAPFMLAPGRKIMALGRGVWLTKSGDVIPVESDHNGVALKFFGIQGTGESGDVTGLDEAYKHGWLRILIMPSERLVLTSGYGATPQQKRNLRDWSLLHGYQLAGEVSLDGTFSLRSGDFSSRMAAAFSPFHRSPELRLAIAQVAKDRAMRLGAEWIDNVLPQRKMTPGAVLGQGSLPHNS